DYYCAMWHSSAYGLF
nr:immunoglobulin light chain junction region [Macaca mulatta]MOX69698.1 immunoglobulin light chain junction region [Macaca mulatta]MOX71292.1 immunoglobulin light chain junction region [Macaca mulatta]MOX71427.1 immunoglobulin light chain junction region [Macaca mulatta]MOX72722.1 immunoglobulin light chain junction region [Macaca mulatta]